MSDDEELICTREGNVLIAQLNRPARRNALSRNLMALLGDLANEADTSPDVRVLVLTGAGDRAFCSGMDLADFASADSDILAKNDSAEAFGRLLNGQLRVPVIGAVNGAAVGGGLELVLACDIVVSSADAKFGLPEVKRGLYAAGTGTSLATRIPLVHALELILTGDTIDAARAAELGLVNKVVPAEEVMATALDYATRIAANGPLGLEASKTLTRAAVYDSAVAEAERAKWQGIVFSSEDAKEGAMSFVEKRAPVWQGK